MRPGGRSPAGRSRALRASLIPAPTTSTRPPAVHGLADVTRRLLVPRPLRVGASPAERPVVTSPLDPGFSAGLACALVWAGLLAVAWKRGRTLEALGPGWIGVALFPVANLLY